MNRRKLVSMALSLMMVTASLGTINGTASVKGADTWRSSLYPSNWTPGYMNSSGQFLQDFSYAGYEKGEKEVPTQMSGMYVNVVNYGADSTGAKDSTSAIQNAINAVEASGGGTVYLPEGTYKVKPTTSNSAALRIKGSNILFKGAGKGKTFIRCYAENMRYSQVINVSPNGGTWNSADDGNYYSLSQDIPKTPTNKIYLSNVGNLKVGDWVIIRSDRTAAWINEHQMSGFWSASVNPTTMGTTFYRQITAVDKNSKTITIDIPTRYYMKTRDNARVYKVTPKQQNVGLTDFSIGNKANSKTNGWGEEDYKTSGTGAYDANNAFLIKFALNVNCFAKNISTYQAENASQIHMISNGLDLSQCRSITIDSCDFSHPQYEGGGGNGYGMNVCSQEALIKNCSSTSARHSFSFKYAYTSGNVIYHYTSTNPKYGSDFHMYLSMSNLIDNEELNGDFVESNVRPYGGTAGNRHGYTSTETVFWNTKGNYYKSGMNYIIDSRQFGNGYIIGTQGAATNVKTTPTTMSSQYGTVNTAPEDYKEGIGKGATLYPQSLYYDQLEKRLSKSSGGETVTETAKKIPGTINATEYASATSGITKNTSTTPNYVGNLVSGSSLEYKVNAEDGTYKVNIGLAAGDVKYNAKNITVKVDGTNAINVPVIGSTSWTEFVQHNLQLTLSNGEHTIAISSVDGAVNIGDIVFTKKIVKEEATNVAKGKNVTTSGNENNEFAGSNAVDGNKDTRWSSNFADNAWIAVDLGKTYAVSKVVLNWEAAYGESYKIQTSTDGKNWTTAKDVTGKNGGIDTITFNTVNARYVRMQGVKRGLPYGYSLWEMEVYATVKETAEYGVVSKGKTASTSGAETDAMAAANAFDGDEGTRWSSNFADDAWISVDLGKTYAIDKVVLNWEGAYGESYKIQTSTDGKNWTTAKDVTGKSGGIDTITFNTVNARYVKMQGVKRGLPYGYSLWEMQVYGK